MALLRHPRRRAKAVFAALLWALAMTKGSPAMASRMSDWQCLTADMTGSAKGREAFIEAASEASVLFNIAPSILVAIKRNESSLSLDPMVINRNANGSVDRGYFQVNAETWLPELNRIGAKVSNQELHGVRANALIAAWILRRQITRHVDTLSAVGYYHKGGGEDQRADEIRRVYKDRFMKNLRTLIRRCGSSPVMTAAR